MRESIDIFVCERNKMIRTSRRSRKAPERLTYQAKEERQIDEEDNENITDPVESDYEGKLHHFFNFSLTSTQF